MLDGVLMDRATVLLPVSRRKAARAGRLSVGLAAEVYVPFEHPGKAPMATAVRSTLIVSSIQTLRSHGLFDAYVSRIDPEKRESLLSLIAGTWAPIDLGDAHYRAADRLGLDARTIDGFGAEVAGRSNRSVFSLVLKLSRESGVTPWTAFQRAHRLRELTWQGSDVAIYKLGPKEARFDWHGIPYAAHPYYVASFGGFLRGLTGLFSRTVYTHLVPRGSNATSISYRISWV
jgi:hypothetical protein